MELKLKQIEWIYFDNFSDGQIYYGILGTFKLFKIKFECGVYFIYSKFRMKNFIDTFEYINVSFVDIEKTKKYCQEVILKEIVEIFMEINGNKMKLLTILGTRPEFIRLSIIIKKLNLLLKDNHIIVNTGQNFSDNVSKIFLDSMYDKDFEFNYNLFIRGSFSRQLGFIFSQLENIIQKEKPDRFFVLGDTNSSMGGIIAKRMGLKVFHLEAGNRSYDDKTPEEVNRRVIDHCSDILLTYSQNSKRILLNEGFKENRVFCVGNPIYEVMINFENEINISRILKKLKLNRNAYNLCTLHRSENIDNKEKLKIFIKTLENISKNSYKLILIVHPHLKENLEKFNIEISENIHIHYIEPVNFFDFINLEKHADIIFTDSGTVQEECQILNKKCIILRDSTERWETIENGSCIITGCNENNIYKAYEYLMKFNFNFYKTIPEYDNFNVSDRVIKILLNNYLW